MKFDSFKNVLQDQRVERTIDKLIFIMRLELWCFIFFSTAMLISVILKWSNVEYGSSVEGLIILISYTTFYLFIFGTIPSLIFAIMVYFYRKYIKSDYPILKKETKLLVVNFINAAIIAAVLTCKVISVLN